MREKSIEFFLELMKQGLVAPAHVSSLVTLRTEQTKAALSANQLGSVLKIVIECAQTYRLTLDNPPVLSVYMQLLNASLKHQLPSIRQLAEQLYVVLYPLHGEATNQ